MTAQRAALTMMMLAAATAAYGAPPPGDRVARSSAGFVRDRAPDELRDPRTLEESRLAAGELIRQPKSSSTLALGAGGILADAWVYDAYAELFYDHDGDGYYRYVRVRFDVDTVRTSMYVYAALFLSADGATWEEYYVTDDFLVRGSSPDDDYEVETELLSGYPPGEYDVLVELYDADSGLLIDEFGPLESAELALLPLEDASYDGVHVSHSDGGGGAADWAFLALLAAAALGLAAAARPTALRTRLARGAPRPILSGPLISRFAARRSKKKPRFQRLGRTCS